MGEHVLALLAPIVAWCAPIVASLTTLFLTRRINAREDERERQRREEREQDERRRAEERLEEERWRDAVTSGLRSILRSELVSEHRRRTRDGFCPMESKEYVERTYESYHALGGNGIGTQLFKELMALPTRGE